MEIDRTGMTLGIDTARTDRSDHAASPLPGAADRERLTHGTQRDLSGGACPPGEPLASASALEQRSLTRGFLHRLTDSGLLEPGLIGLER
jgi:hypothetical protein